MAADPVHGHVGRDLAFAGVEGDALAIDVAHHLRDMLDREGMTQESVAHAAPGRIGHLAILQVEARVGETVEIAGVVVMQMGDDDVLDPPRRLTPKRSSASTGLSVSLRLAAVPPRR